MSRTCTLGGLALATFLALVIAGCTTQSPDSGNGNGNTNGNTNDNSNDDNTNDNATNDNGGTDGNDNGATDGLNANAGADQDVNGGDVVQLDGSASSDPNGGSLSFSWTQTDGTQVALTGGGTDSPTFTAPNVNDTLTFELAVGDDMDGAATDSVDINVTAVQTTLFVVNNQGTTGMVSFANAGSANGEVVPSARLSAGSATSLFQPRSIVVTRDGRLLISRGNGGIVGYDSTLSDDGGTPADVVVDGDNTILESPISLAYDATNDRLYVGDANADAGILVFENASAADFNGDISPDRTFGPGDRIPFATDSTSISMTVDALELDSDGNLYVSDTSGLNSNQSRILVFANPGSAEGLAEPIREFTSSSWSNIEDIVVDANDVLYVVAGDDSILMFNNASTLEGDVSPSTTVTVPVDLADLQGIVVGSDGTGYVSDNGNHAIYSFDGLASFSGTLAPNRTLEGFDTSLRNPRQMFLLE